MANFDNLVGLQKEVGKYVDMFADILLVVEYKLASELQDEK